MRKEALSCMILRKTCHNETFILVCAMVLDHTAAIQLLITRKGISVKCVLTC